MNHCLDAARAARLRPPWSPAILYDSWVVGWWRWGTEGEWHAAASEHTWRAGVSSYLSCRLRHSLLLGSVPVAGAESATLVVIRYSLLVIVAGPLER